MAVSTVRRTRFAPSPTGRLHLGHAFAALTAERQADPGKFLLRIENIDAERCKPEFEDAIYRDLDWLGLQWTAPVLRQSDRIPAYQNALQRLAPYSYPCRCKRGDIRAALSAPQEGALPAGPDGLIYPGTCRHRRVNETGPDDVIRLDVARAFDAISDQSLEFQDECLGGGTPFRIDKAQFLKRIGDIILSRRGMGTSYHLSVVIDDAAQGISVVTRGSDLFESTWIHVLLQRLLSLPTPIYHHHRLIRDNSGTRLAKRDNARSLMALRENGVTPEEIRTRLGFS
ncbi:tRNA glutamyl-Q(34) synthetase GluQRS [Paracoccus sp. Z330]|uniref:tRNA glutamyl-Q(34) synthetase GluQRS n=1 Tax=Paracoccus onchidii TaxID=3017813 RepID=A0ABT4ZGS1_9RHOB|nr:tRNA glutamyl-Q(34) synthetase GluQRS [Paracoccus onchidii]MDB6178556.1 tRNA glutamyl-Q(34) synthetase GluQRS [Paracoccus onchidii]